MRAAHGHGERLPDEVTSAWDLAGAAVVPVEMGLINRTLRVERGGARFALQRLHPVFEGRVCRDIDAITGHLEHKGLPTPRPVPTGDGRLWIEAPDGPWRMMTWLDGRVATTLQGPAMAREAGALAGRFHVALSDLEHDFEFTRPGAHDTPAHLRALAAALEAHAGHWNIDAVRPVAELILEHGAQLPALPERPLRIVHGDLKVTNVLFDDMLGRAVALIDLDTIAWGTIAVEMGDALRSWCNPAGEDAVDAAVDRPILDAAREGYLAEAGALLEPAERDSIAAGLETIALELAARFCRDALEERYFAWRPEHHASRSEHNVRRARSQLSLARSAQNL